MATFYLPSSGGYSTSNEYINYRIVITEGTLSNRTRPITVSVQFYRTNTGYTTTRNGTCYCSINGTSYSQAFTTDSELSYNSYTVLFTKTVNITYGNDGKATVPIYAYWQTQTTSSGGESYSSNSQGGNVVLTAISPVTYTITFNANGGTWSHGNATCQHGSSVTFVDAWPSKTGYTFKGWGTSSTSTSPSYYAGGTYRFTSNITLYAIWAENYLTVNYYSNYATSYNGTSTAKNTVNNNNVLIWTQDYYYDNAYSSGLNNYLSGETLGMVRTGYTATGNWGTSTSGGTLVHQDTSFNTGQALAKALGKDLSSGNASINIYAQWREHVLTINYYSNHADYGTYQGESLNVNSNNNILVCTQEILYDDAYTYGLADVQNEDYLYLSRTGYTPTGEWGTSTSGGILIDQTTSFATGQSLAEALGKSLKTSDSSINIYIQWTPNKYILTLDSNDGTENKVTLHVTYDSSDNSDISDYIPTRLGYKFLGYYSSPAGNVQIYDATGQNTNDGVYWEDNIWIRTQNTTVYAQWEALNVAYYKIDDTYKLCRTYIKINNTWQPAIMYKKIDNNYKRSIVQ